MLRLAGCISGFCLGAGPEGTLLGPVRTPDSHAPLPAASCAACLRAQPPPRLLLHASSPLTPSACPPLQGSWTGGPCCQSCTRASCGRLRCPWAQLPAPRPLVSAEEPSGCCCCYWASQLAGLASYCSLPLPRITSKRRLGLPHLPRAAQSCAHACPPVPLLPPPRSLPRPRPRPAAVQLGAEEPQQLHRQSNCVPAGAGRRQGERAGRPRWVIFLRFFYTFNFIFFLMIVGLPPLA